MRSLVRVVFLAITICVCAFLSFWPLYFYYTRNGFRETNVLGGWITDKGNYYRTRKAVAPYQGPIYPDMSDIEFGSRVVHSICASGAPCIDKSKYRMRVLRSFNGSVEPVVSFGADLGAPWRQAIVPGDRYICHFSNPYWFSCLAGSFGRTEYRFIPDGPYTPIEMWDEDGAAHER